MALITRYGEHWERAKMLEVEETGKVDFTELAWPYIKEARGIYVLYRGATAIYIGLGLKGKSPIAVRLLKHAQGAYLAPWWNNVCWYHFHKSVSAEVIKAIEALMIAHAESIWNGAQPQKCFGKQYFLGDADDDRENRLWASAGEQSDVAE